jgi:transposase
MARPPRHRIELGEDERVTLERVARAEKLPFQEVQRARIVLYAAEGLHDTEIAARLDTSPGLVGRWRRRFAEQRLEGLRDKPRSGRPRRFSPRAGRRGQGDRVRAAGHPWPAAGPLLGTELHRLVIERGVTEASPSTIWRWLHDDALKPWQTRSWIFPRDPAFAWKAGRALDLYERVFEGKRLRPDEYVICADEKSQLQALRRRHATVPVASGRPALVEFDYERGGTLAYLAAWDVHHANLFDRVEPKTGIEPFGRLVEHVMTTEPYASARRVFWIVDNGSSHAGKTSIARIQDSWANAHLIHLPIHASWLNQIELYFSIVQRKALTPNDFDSLEQLAARLLTFGEHYRQIATSFEWTFTRHHLDRVLDKIADREPALRLAA